MGLILDTSNLIACERRGGAVEDILDEAWSRYGEQAIGISTLSVVELTHGIYRARNDIDKQRRREFSEDVFEEIEVYAVTFEIAALAGKVEGEQAAVGIAIPFEDLVIGATALHFGYDVATHNGKHFQLIPGLKIAAF